MKAMTKHQLAIHAGISVRTQNKWCQPHRKHLEALGMTSHMKILPPHIVGWICHRQEKYNQKKLPATGVSRGRELFIDIVKTLFLSTSQKQRTSPSSGKCKRVCALR